MCSSDLRRACGEAVKNFQLSCQVTVSAYTVVEADTLEEAMEIAKDRTVGIARNYDSSGQAADEWVIEEGDGEPKEISA